MTTVRAVSSVDLRLISQEAHRFGGRTVPGGAEGMLLQAGVHILQAVGDGCPRHAQDRAVLFVRTRASLALQGMPTPAECYLDVRYDQWVELTDAAEAVKMTRLNPDWRVPSPLTRKALAQTTTVEGGPGWQGTGTSRQD